jgi:hypothetical protein
MESSANASITATSAARSHAGGRLASWKMLMETVVTRRETWSRAITVDAAKLTEWLAICKAPAGAALLYSCRNWQWPGALSHNRPVPIFTHRPAIG